MLGQEEECVSGNGNATTVGTKPGRSAVGPFGPRRSPPTRPSDGVRTAESQHLVNSTFNHNF
jgi:hypothetical protein